MGWHRGDLTRESGGNNVEHNPTSHVFNAERTQHMFHSGAGHLSEVWWRGADSPQADPLSDEMSTPPKLQATGDPVSHVFAPDGTQHVFYPAPDPRLFRVLIELWFKN